MKSGSVYARVLLALNRYLVFFLLMAFIITCCMMLFISTMQRAMGITLTEENITTAAKLTFCNVILLSAICTAIDGLRRKITIDRPVKSITEAARRMMQGDFSVRIPPVRSPDAQERFSEIIDCLNRMAAELSGIETLRTDFISNVSHELKTPLAVMHNYGTLLQQPGLSEEARIEYAKNLTAASRRLADLITNILRLSKLENQQILPCAVSYDLGEQLCECLLDFEELWEAKELSIETELAENVIVESDPEMIRLIWSNLFSNAVKFSPMGGKITLRLWEEDNFAVVEVSDTGCGISPEAGAHIFDKFYQADSSRSCEGNGLGLALVKRIIEITHSEISVSSEPGHGSTFTVRLRRDVHAAV